MTEAVLFEMVDGVGTITLNQPERRNALSRAVSKGLNEAWVRAARDKSLRVLIVTGAGSAFCAGADTEAFNRPGPGAEEKLISPLDPDPQYAAALPETPAHLRSRHLFAQALPIPVIAAVNGLAIGAGLALALSADIRIGDSNAAFQAGFPRIGAAPELGLCWTASELIGLARARDLLLTGRRVGADEALGWGLVTKLTEPGQLMDQCRILANEMVERTSPYSARMTKRLLATASTQSFAEAVEASRLEAGPALAGPDFREGIAALRERRAPVWPSNNS